MDRMTAALDPEHAARAARYERLLRQRNRLLEEPSGNGQWLDALEAQLAQAAVSVAAARLGALEALRAGMKAVEKDGGAFPFAALALQGTVENRLAESPAVKVEDALREELARSRRADAAAGRTLTGPHRTALEVVHGPKGMAAKLCSTGEQKALLIAIILAHARAVRDACGGFAPVMLLDEVGAHLDAARRRGLFSALEALGCQAWMTGTEETLFEDLRGRALFLRVNEGHVAPAC
jgi:DNA replication and repair protein RecF